MRWITMMVVAVAMVGCGGAGEEPARRGMGQGAYFDDRPYDSECGGAEFRTARELAQARNGERSSTQDPEIEPVVPDCGLEPGVAGLSEDGLDCEGEPDTTNTCELEESCVWDVHRYTDGESCQFDVICITDAVIEEQGRLRPYAYADPELDDYIITDADQYCAGGGVVECSPFGWPDNC